MNIGLVTLYVHDLQKSKDFYVNTLGLTIDESQTGPVFVMLRSTNGWAIALEDVKILPPGQAKPAGSLEIGFEVADVDALYKQWEAQGIEMVSEPIDKPFCRSFLAKDPEGHYLTMYRLAA